MNEEKDQSKSESLHSSEEEKKQQYQYGLDIVRFTAMFFVVTFHAQLFNFLPYTKIETPVLFLCSICTYISYSCNGLFMILTGYLKLNKKPSGLCFYKIIQFIIEYILCSIACVFWRVYKAKEKLTAQQIINGLYVFTDVTHGWFVRMYIGLFLLSPFLNILYNNIKTPKIKCEFLAVLIVVFALPQTYY